MAEAAGGKIGPGHAIRSLITNSNVLCKAGPGCNTLAASWPVQVLETSTLQHVVLNWMVEVSLHKVRQHFPKSTFIGLVASPKQKHT